MDRRRIEIKIVSYLQLLYSSALAVIIVTGSFLMIGSQVLLGPADTKLTIDVLWPEKQAFLLDKQEFALTLSEYNDLDLTVYLDIEDGHLKQEMSYDGSRFVAAVDTYAWDWKKDGRYNILFSVFDVFGNLLATDSRIVFVGTPYADQKPEDVPSESLVEEIELVVSDYAAAVVTSSSAVSSENRNYDVDNLLKVTHEISKASDNQKFIIEYKSDKKVTAFWKAEGGHQNLIYQKDENGPFITSINFSGWRWRGAGPYPVHFIVNDAVTNLELAKVTYELRWLGEPGVSNFSFNKMASTESEASKVVRAEVVETDIPAVSVPKLPVVVPGRSRSADFFSSTKLLSVAKPAVSNNLSSLRNESHREALNYLLSQPNSVWLNGDAYETNAYIERILNLASQDKAIPVFVLYNIPERDCGSHSSGGVAAADDYRAWIDRLAGVFANREAIIIVEPDALAQLNCISETRRADRISLLSYAVSTLTRASNRLAVYIDAGHPFWVNADEMASRLKQVGVEEARGFALNVSSFASTQDNITYGNYLSSLLGGAAYVIDTSRNGLGPNAAREWCNPRGRGLGESGKIVTGKAGALDALLWIKYPGESDGTCNGGPGAGQWWTEYALELYENRVR